jgi:hypothetical protein
MAINLSTPQRPIMTQRINGKKEGKQLQREREKKSYHVLKITIYTKNKSRITGPNTMFKNIKHEPKSKTDKKKGKDGPFIFSNNYKHIPIDCFPHPRRKDNTALLPKRRAELELPIR